jgi:hypothetical protein
VLDPAQLVFAEAVQFLLNEAAPAEEIRENEREDRIAVVVHAIDLLPALGEVLFKFPETGRLLNLRGLAFRFLG